MSHPSSNEPPIPETHEVTGRPLATMLATLVAGPSFVALALPSPDGIGDVPVWLLLCATVSLGLAPFTMPVTLLIIGVAVWCGGRLGQWSRTFRHPLAWATTGVIVGLVIAPAVMDPFGRFPSPWASALAGMMIALFARRFVDWID